MINTFNYKRTLTVRQGRSLGEGAAAYIVAEIGTNHNRDFDTAVRLVRAVAEAGCDCAKFQVYEPEEIVSGKVMASAYGLDKIYGDISARLMFEKYLKTPKEWLPELKALCRSLDIDFAATIHGDDGLQWAKGLGLDLVKIASMDHTNLPLLKNLVNQLDAPILVSLGMADLEDIDAIAKTLEPHRHGFGLFHCCAVYPPTPDELRLRNIPFLAERFSGLPIGFSDHTIETEAALHARSLGAMFFEKHVTLDRKMSGPDHAFAIETGELASYVSRLKGAADEKIEKSSRFEPPAERELKNKRSYLKSVVAKHHIPAGQLISHENVYLARPGTGVRPGDLAKVIGKKAKREISAEDPIQWDFLDN